MSSLNDHISRYIEGDGTINDKMHAFFGAGPDFPLALRGGVKLKTKAGAFADGDFVSPPDNGSIAGVDTTNHRLYFKSGNTWRYLLDNMSPGPFQGGLGSNTAPTWSFSSEPDTGMYGQAGGGLLFTLGGTKRYGMGQSGFAVLNDASIGWSSDPLVQPPDARLWRDEANVIAQRNLLSKQEYRLYGTYTSLSDYERLSIKVAPSGSILLESQAAGSGVPRDIYLGTLGASKVGLYTNNTTRYFLDASGHLIAQTTGMNTVLAKNALATGATNGFVYLPSVAGVPTGVPTAYDAAVPILIDTTNSRLYARIGGVWKSVTLS